MSSALYHTDDFVTQTRDWHQNRLARYGWGSVDGPKPHKSAEHYWARRSFPRTDHVSRPFAVAVGGRTVGPAHETVSQHVCTPEPRRAVLPQTQWPVCARWDLQTETIVCINARFLCLKKIKAQKMRAERGDRVRRRQQQREPGPEQQKTASHYRHAASSHRSPSSVCFYLNVCLRCRACKVSLPRSGVICTHLYRSAITSALNLRRNVSFKPGWLCPVKEPRTEL